MAIKIFPYRAGSRSASALARALGGRVLRRERSTYRRNPRDLIINWGSGEVPRHLGDVLNSPAALSRASNKLHAFQAFQRAGNVNIPRFYTRREDIPNDAFPIVCRTILSGHSGRGIVISNNRNELVNAPLYVAYVKKQEDYRVHIVRGRVIVVQRKARDRDNPNPNWQVRNHDNGFVFVRGGFNAPPEVIEQAQRAVTALGLDFGAADIIYNNRQRQAYVLEVNTAPGLEGQTVTDYANAFQALTR